MGNETVITEVKDKDLTMALAKSDERLRKALTIGIKGLVSPEEDLTDYSVNEES